MTTHKLRYPVLLSMCVAAAFLLFALVPAVIAAPCFRDKASKLCGVNYYYCFCLDYHTQGECEGASGYVAKTCSNTTNSTDLLTVLGSNWKLGLSDNGCGHRIWATSTEDCNWDGFTCICPSSTTFTWFDDETDLCGRIQAVSCN